VKLETRPGRPLRGRIRVPGDKSVSHRALMFNGLGRGEARIEGLLDALDVKATATCMRRLGVHLARRGEATVVRGLGGALKEPTQVLDCGNSGTSMRLLAGLIAGQDLFAVLTGDASLNGRPMGRVADPLRAMGARIDAREGGTRPPLAIRGGGLVAGAYTSPVASAQVKSCLMLATLGAREGTLEFREPTRSRDHTERMLRAMGVVLEERGDALLLEAGQVPECRDVIVPGDVSSAAFFLVAAAITPGSDLVVENVGLNPTRSGVIDVLEAMGARIEVLDRRDASGEPVGDLRVLHSELKGARVEGDLIPRLVDEIPALAIAASFAQGESVFADAAEARVKECDRIAVTVSGLRTCGVEVEERPDGMVVQGGGFSGGSIEAHHDHRIAMAFAVAGCASGGVQVPDASAVATSFPSFSELLESCR